MFEPAPEFELLERIQRTPVGAAKDRLIEELDAMPVDRCKFYARWTRVHETWDFDGWTDNGYDSSLVALPRDIQLLSATEYGVSDILNGGLHQFFGNGTGVFAPEMIEWFERAGMPAAAEILRQALDRFDGGYSRSHEQRHEYLLSRVTDGDRCDWDPFYDLDDPFFEALGGDDDDALTRAADRWLRETCGIRKLSDSPRPATKGS